MRDGEDKAKSRSTSAINPEKEAMDVMDLSYPLTKEKIKRQFRILVKKYHPDAAGKETEEQFKSIAQAYELLKKNYATG